MDVISLKYIKNIYIKASVDWLINNYRRSILYTNQTAILFVFVVSLNEANLSNLAQVTTYEMF